MVGISKNIGWALAGNIGAPVAGFLSAPILAQVLGADGRGEVAAATAPLLLAANAVTLGLPEAATFLVARKGAFDKRTLTRAVGSLLAISVVSLTVIHVVTPVLSNGDPELSRLIRVASTALPAALVLSLVRGIASGKARWNLVALERIINAVMRLALVGAFALTGTLTPLSASLAIASSTFVGVCAYLPLLSTKGGRVPQETEFRYVLGFGLRVWAGSLTGILLTRVDQLLMVPLSGARQLGLYAVAVTVAELVLVFNSAIKDVMFQAESEQPSESRLAQATRLSSLITGISVLAVASLAYWLVPLLFGEDFRGAVPVIWLLLFAIFVGNSGSVAGSGLNARGRPGLKSVSLSTALIVNIILLLVFVPEFGAMGAAAATLAGNAVAGYMNLFWLRIKFGMKMVSFIGLRRTDVSLIKAKFREVSQRLLALRGTLGINRDVR